jgi:L-lactate dehydrogenase complex protein LldG
MLNKRTRKPEFDIENMNHQTSREIILNRISGIAARRGLQVGETAEESIYLQEEIYKPILPDALTCFKQELEAVSGQCIICAGEEDMYQKLAALVEEKGLPFLFSKDSAITKKLQQAGIPVEEDEAVFVHISAGITPCESLIARTGSVVISTAGESGRQMHVFPPVHLVLAKGSQLVNYAGNALELIQQKYGKNMPSALTIITGPSRTADIEKTLVLGAHGPKELIIFVDRNQ